MAWDAERDQQWRTLSEEVMSGLQEWRAAHPRATFAEIEAVVDERLNGLRARMLENLALARAAAERAAGEEDRPACPDCGQPLQRRGYRTRTVTVQGGQAVRLRRAYAVCPACGTGVFPPG
jgi:YgiT-type zinc finger domain-containing protein